MDMKAIVRTSKKACAQVGNIFANPTSDKMHYVNQRMNYGKSGESSHKMGAIPRKSLLETGFGMNPLGLR